MPGDRLSWGAQALWQQLAPVLPGIGVEVVARIESTNSELLARARQQGGRRGDDQAPCLLVAEQQTRGRGRQGKPWLSHAGASLTFSLSLGLQPADWSGLSLAVGVALADALQPQWPAAGPRLMLKWPNDLWLSAAPGQGRKLGGILIETLMSAGLRWAVVGVGLNIQPQALEGLDSGYACLQEIDPAVTAPSALACVALPLVRALRCFEQDGFAPFAEGFARRDLLRGQRVGSSSPEAPEGIAEGVDAQGALLLRGRELHTIVGGEVSVRPLAPGREPPAC